MTPKPRLSRLALDIYDKSGEKAMFNFIINNKADFINQKEDPWQETGYHTLADGSQIYHNLDDQTLYFDEWGQGGCTGSASRKTATQRIPYLSP